MPVHDVEGSLCNRIHELSIEGQVLNRKTHRCPCRTKGCRASIIYLPRSMRSYNQSLPGVVYYTNKKGEVQVAASSHDPTPKGWQRCEANTLNELRALESRMNREQLDIREKFVEREQAHMAETIAENRRSLRTDMEQFSEKGKAFAREMMRRNDNRRSVYDKKVDPGVHFNILHYDGGEKR